MCICVCLIVRSVWFAKYKDQLFFDPTNLQQLSFTYAENYTCTIHWKSSAKGRSRRYDVEFGTVDKTNRLVDSNNPHWKITTFLRDVLNEKRDLIYFVQVKRKKNSLFFLFLMYFFFKKKKILFHTLPELLEFVC